MKVICTGNTYRVYGDDLEVFDSLPTGAYHVNFSEMTGFSLSTHPDIEIHEKMYGVHEQKSEKVLDAFDVFERSLGVILSGDKGIGKSMFAKLLCVKAMQRGFPVVVIDQYIPGIARFIESIDQEAVILFDEFDKTFSTRSMTDTHNPQTELLSLFDGISPGKKLFVITCNNLRDVSDLLVNRPGRFHYHFRFEYPNAQEICDYLNDHLNEKYRGQIDSVVSFAQKIPINYDCLRSIAFELNAGESFGSAIKDLNIVNINSEKYRFELHFADGTVLFNRMAMCDLFGDDVISIPFYDRKGDNLLDVEFSTAEIVYDASTGLHIVPGDTLSFSYVDSDDARARELADTDVLSVNIRRVLDRDIHYVA